MTANIFREICNRAEKGDSEAIKALPHAAAALLIKARLFGNDDATDTAPVWTKVLPTKEGWYWVNDKIESAGMIYVDENNMFWIMGWECSTTIQIIKDRYPDAEWYGPITPPF